MHTDHLVVGAGVAGLTCARELVRAGHRVILLDKARGVGGRCATRRVEGQPVDFGPVFLHGSNPEFLRTLRDIPNIELIDEWPRRRRGSGKPCQYEAFLPTERRFAIAEGLTAFPKYLATDLDVRLGTRVTEVKRTGDGFEVAVAGEQAIRTRSLVLALPVEQTSELIWPLVKDSQELEAVAILLDMVTSLPCLTLMAGYDLNVPLPNWDVFYPETSTALMLVAHDSAKRKEPKFRTLVLQAGARWSRAHLQDHPDAWSAALLGEAGELIGPWAAEPIWQHAHRWAYSRVDLGNELTGPVRVIIPGGPSIGLAGDVFAPGGGVEAAWNAGRTLAGRLLREE